MRTTTMSLSRRSGVIIALIGGFAISCLNGGVGPVEEEVDDSKDAPVATHAIVRFEARGLANVYTTLKGATVEVQSSGQTDTIWVIEADQPALLDTIGLLHVAKEYSILLRKSGYSGGPLSFTLADINSAQLELNIYRIIKRPYGAIKFRRAET